MRPQTLFTTAAMLVLMAPLVTLAAGCASETRDDQGNNTDGTADADDALTNESSALAGDVKVGETLETTANLNLRTGPSTSHSVILVIPEGGKVTVVAAAPSGGFYHVKYGSHEGWSSGLYLKQVSSGSSNTAVNRAESWVTAHMPYCGGVNHGHDYICGGTCDRTGAANNSAWNSYRSDCSGLISYAWGLPAPGRVTSEFAPYNGGVSYVINASSLQPGDALNSRPDEHIILFAGWINRSAGKARIIEEYNCGHVATDHELTLQISGTSVYIPDWSPHSYTAIRHR